MSGGTDLVGCFGIGNPLLPVYVGGCASFSIGIAVKVYDQTIEGGIGVKGLEVPDGVPGELVSDKAFPTMPITFLGEDGPKRYFDSYFARFDGVWTHGDFIMVHPVTKQLFFLGRADGVLNPSGVRFGSAEIYSIIENRFGDRISDSICVGQRRPTDDDERVMLFLLMKPGVQFTPKLVREVKEAIRKETSPRHVPRFVFETKEIPVSFVVLRNSLYVG
jgi:acetoacetyl-CoA synthetase